MVLTLQREQPEARQLHMSSRWGRQLNVRSVTRTHRLTLFLDLLFLNCWWTPNEVLTNKTEVKQNSSSLSVVAQIISKQREPSVKEDGKPRGMERGRLPEHCLEDLPHVYTDSIISCRPPALGVLLLNTPWHYKSISS